MLVALRPRESTMSLTSRIRVLVVHDDPLARAGLAVALCAYSDIEVFGTDGAADVEQLMLWSHGPPPADVVVADYKHGTAIAAHLARISASPNPPKVMIVSGSDREWEIRDAMERGVRGYFLVGCALDDLACGVRAVHRGSRHFSQEVVQRLAESMSNEPLTTREEEVLQLVVDGLNNKAIARRLGIAVGTVKTHLRATFDKLCVESRTQAVIAVGRRGLLRGITCENPADQTKRASSGVRTKVRAPVGKSHAEVEVRARH